MGDTTENIDEQTTVTTEDATETSTEETPTIASEDSILTSIKKLLGPEEEYDYFDTDIIVHINSALMVLTQLGVGPSTGFVITDKSAVWTDFVPDINRLAAIKTYVYLKVKLVFDPPQSAAAIESTNKMISELEWRINVAAETESEEV